MSSDGWTAVRISDFSDRAAVISAVFRAGAEGLQEFDDHVVAHIRGIGRKDFANAVRSSDSSAALRFEEVADLDWSKAWRDRITAHRVGRLVVTPPWLAEDFSVDERIVIDPGMAFGTGDHETTRSVLHLMQQCIRPGDRVADVGAGSAILSIAAVKLGAARAVAIELDPDAIGNAEKNVDDNGVSNRVAVILGDAAALLPLVAPVNVVLANIVTAVLVELLDAIAGALTPDGVAILSGILAEESDQLVQEASLRGLMVRARHVEGIWFSVALRR